MYMFIYTQIYMYMFIYIPRFIITHFIYTQIYMYIELKHLLK